MTFQEFVGPESNLSTIVEGNPQRTGAAVTVFSDHIHVHVKVKGQGGWGAPGKFKAVYRVWWEPGPPPHTLQAWSEPQPPPLNRAISVVVRAQANDTGEAVSGTVLIKGRRIGTTGTPFTYTFRTTISGGETIYPTGVVRAAGFPDAAIDFGFP